MKDEPEDLWDRYVNLFANYPHKRPEKFSLINNDKILDITLLYQGRGQTNFTTLLLSLLEKADQENFKKLSETFPEEAFITWLVKNGLTIIDLNDLAKKAARLSK